MNPLRLKTGALESHHQEVDFRSGASSVLAIQPSTVKNFHKVAAGTAAAVVAVEGGSG